MKEALRARIGVGYGDVVAIVGAGGKSTVALRLGREIAEAGMPVVVSTTTKMGADQIPDWAPPVAGPAALGDVLSGGGAVFLAERIEGDKVVGVAPGVIDRIHAESPATTIVVEADGARRRAFKAPAAHEPVIPVSAALVVVVAGLDALGGRIADVCHRPERVAALAGRSADDVLLPADMAAVLAHPDGGLRAVPEGARVVAVLTKAKSETQAAAAEIARLIAGKMPVVVIEDDAP